MATLYDEITPKLTEWIGKQHMFFVATAPMTADGHINCSPKGLDSLRILGPRRVAYLDLTGSGIETIAHLRENARIVFMFCAFEGAPKILRLHGKGRFVTPCSDEWEDLRGEFPEFSGVRSIVLAKITRVCDSCGFGVPRYDFVEERRTLENYWIKNKGDDGPEAYQQAHNLTSVDGLPGLEPE